MINQESYREPTASEVIGGLLIDIKKRAAAFFASLKADGLAQKQYPATARQALRVRAAKNEVAHAGTMEFWRTAGVAHPHVVEEGRGVAPTFVGRHIPEGLDPQAKGQLRHDHGLTLLEARGFAVAEKQIEEEDNRRRMAV